MSGKKKALLALMAVIFLMAVMVIIFALIYRNKLEAKITAMEGTTSASKSLGKWQEGTIEYNGKKYKYNNQLKVYLLMGIDTDEKVKKAEDYQMGGQSDALFLLVADPDTESYKIISIHRNTMTDIYMCDVDGSYVMNGQAQICVQHGFGDGMELSCQRTVTAVENMFDGIPIDGYVSVNMGAIPAINDAVGGVTLEVLDDIKTGDVDLKKVETVTLTGEEAYSYVRNRDTEVDDSASQRLKRQQQFITAFLEQVKAAGGDTAGNLENVYNSISDYTVTNLMVADDLGAIVSYSFDPDDIYTVPGEVVIGDVYEEYYIDEDAFQQLIINVFYKERVNHFFRGIDTTTL